VRSIQDSLAEWSSALASGASPQGRGFEPHSCQITRFFRMKLRERGNMPESQATSVTIPPMHRALVPKILHRPRPTYTARSSVTPQEWSFFLFWISVLKTPYSLSRNGNATRSLMLPQAFPQTPPVQCAIFQIFGAL
jgi:hypothetical protein